MTTHLSDYGILGVGSIAAAIVTGLCSEVEEPPTVLLSPRSEHVSAKLAARLDGVSVAADNQAVIDGSATVIICLRRADADLLGELSWRPEQVVVSAIAGLPLERLAELVAPSTQVARAVPMPAVAGRASETPVHPPIAPVVALFDRLGGALPIEDGGQFEAVFTALGTVAPFFEYLGVIAAFLVDHGLPVESAQGLVAQSFEGVLAGLEEEGETDFAELVKEYAPPGGGNAQLTALMTELGVFTQTRHALDTVHERLIARN
jgi:pyrroline-5-carboxylate reductase